MQEISIYCLCKYNLLIYVSEHINKMKIMTTIKNVSIITKLCKTRFYFCLIQQSFHNLLLTHVQLKTLLYKIFHLYAQKKEIKRIRTARFFFLYTVHGQTMFYIFSCHQHSMVGFILKEICSPTSTPNISIRDIQSSNHHIPHY